jgi:hypothetical protein
LYTSLLSPIRATFTAPLILLDFITRIIFHEEHRSCGSSLCGLLHYPLTSSLGPNTFLNTLFSNTLSLVSSHNMSDQVSHPYTTGKIAFLNMICLLMFVFLALQPTVVVFSQPRSGL